MPESMRLLTIGLLLSVCTTCLAQKIPVRTKPILNKLRTGQPIAAADLGFAEYALRSRDDTVSFYTYTKPNSRPTSLYVFLPGTNPDHVYSYHKDTDSTYWWSSLTAFDFSFMPNDYMFVIVAKPGFGLVGNGDTQSVPTAYWKKTSLMDRVQRADKAINYLARRVLKKPKRVVCFGYSEGFYVAAKLATLNERITHLAIGGGGGYIDFYDFVLMNRIAVHKGEKTPEKSQTQLEATLANFRRIMLKPESTDDFASGYTHKRWASFAEPPIGNLSKVKIPILMVHGTSDENTPIENAYIVPLEFARLGKTNLTFKTYLNGDHSLVRRTADGKEENQWTEMLADLFQWVDQQAVR